ncbi:MAG: lipopolysaccharide biosynthesis protein [Ruminococcus sp.]
MYNSMTTALHQLIVMIAGFITPRFMLVYYGSEMNGLVSSITQFITYFNLVEAGLAGAAVYSLYKPLADNDHAAISGVVSAAKHFYNVSGGIFAGLIGVLAIFYPIFVNTSALSPWMVAILVVVLGAKSFLDFFTLSKYRVLLTADQKVYVVSLASSIYTILNTVVIVVLSMLHVNIVILYIAAILPLASRSVILYFYVKKNYPYVDYHAKRNDAALSKRWDALFLQILQSVQTGAPTVIATIFTSLKTVSVYSVFNMVMTGINGLLAIFQSGLSASFGDIIARKETKTLQKAYNQFEFLYYTIIFFVYSVAGVMLQSFVNIYTHNVTDTNYHQPLLAFLFTLNGLLYNIKTPQGMLVISAGHYKETRWRSLAQALIAVIGGVALAPFFGLNGIMVGLILSNLYRVIDLFFYIPKYVTKLSPFVTIFRVLRMLIAAVIIYLPSLFLDINPGNYLEWVLYALGFAVYAGVILLAQALIFERENLKAVLERIKGMLKKSK